MKRRRMLLLNVAIVLVWNANAAVSTSRSYRHISSEATLVTVSVKVNKANSVHISMGVSNIEDDITGYKVYFTRHYEKGDESFADWQQIDVKTSDRNYVLKMDGETLHLKPNTKYRMRVTATTSDGDTHPSEVVEFQTGTTVPRAPSNVSVVLHPDNRFTVYFDAAVNPNSTDDQPKYVNEYTVEFTSDNPTSADAVWESFNFLVDGLTKQNSRVSKSFSNVHVEPNTNYSLRVFTYGRAQGAASNLVFFETSTAEYSPAVSIVGPSIVKMDPSLSKGYKIKCEAVGDPPASISWLVNGSLPVTNGTNGFTIQQHINELTTVSELTVPTRSRSEVFLCIGSNSLGSDQAPIEVKILGPGTAPTDIAATSDSLGVHVSWNPPPIPNGEIEKYIVYWTKGETLELADWKQVVLNANKTRTLINADGQTDPFFVRVQSTSNRGPGIISEKVIAKPTVTELPLKTQIVLVNIAVNMDETNGTVVEPGGDIEFKCIVEGRPPPNVSFYWTAAEGQLHKSPTTMAFRNIPPNTVESYEVTTRTYSSRFLVCRGQNVREISEARMFFNVGSMDSNNTQSLTAPNNLRAERMDNNDVALLWDPTSIGNDAEMYYNIYVCDDVNKPIRKWTLLTTNETELVLTKERVSPGYSYYFRVAAVNEFGEGFLSAPMQFLAPTGGPGSPPQSVKIGVDEANVVVIAWKRPNNTNGALIKYTIYFTRDPAMDDEDYKNWQFVDITTAADEFQYKMEEDKVGLRPKTLYRVRLTAANEIAESEPTEVMEFETAQGEFPVPTDVQVEVQKDNTVIVQFTAVKNPEDHSAYIEDYDVLLSPSTDALVAQFLPVAIARKTFDPNTARITMKISPKQLSTMTQYWAKVQARIPNREVQASKPRRFQTGDGSTNI